MLKKALGLAVAAAGLSVAQPASAGEFLNITGPTGVYGNLNVTCLTTAPCSFTNLFSFVTPVGYDLVSLDLTSVSISPETNIDFTPGSVTLNGVALTFDSFGAIDEAAHLYNQLLSPGAINVLSVSGLSGGSASFTGTLAFASSVVPEPGTWMLMVTGIGAIGVAMRRKRKTTTVRTAMA